MEFAQRRRVEPQLDSGLAASTAATSKEQGLLRPAHRNARRPRHAGIFEAVHRIDASLDPAMRAELGKWIRDEYEREYGDIPLGLFAQCHLGPPYVDHRLDLWQSIVEHYSRADTVPPQFAEARTLVRAGAYDYVEVYASGKTIPVLKDGSVVA
jgi:hypothetical protein